MRRIEWMAVGWGGLIAAIGLLIGAGRGDTTLLASVVVAFLVGGFLAGVRAAELRPVNAAFAAIAAYLFHGVFTLLAHVADVLGGPSAPGFLPGSNATWGFTALVGLVVAVAGGVVATLWLRPQRRDQRRRVA